MKHPILFPALLTLALAGCGGGPATDSTPEISSEANATQADDSAPKPPVNRVIVQIVGKSGSELMGTAKIGRIKDGIAMGITLDDAPPGVHAIHLHEVGDCSAEDASSAGGHWNPTGEDHGKWGTPPHHLGDVGNIVVGDDYKGELKFTSDRWTLGTGEANDILGKAIVVHAGPDDFTSQPTGAAGGRIGCGVFG